MDQDKNTNQHKKNLIVKFFNNFDKKKHTPVESKPNSISKPQPIEADLKQKFEYTPSQYSDNYYLNKVMEWVESTLEYIVPKEPTDPIALEQYRKNQQRQQALNDINRKLKDRNYHLEQEHKQNLKFLNTKTDTCKAWSKEEADRMKIVLDSNKHLLIEPGQYPEDHPNWRPEIENKRKSAQRLCERLDCFPMWTFSVGVT